ncbi:hypothetical protein D1007_45670 [Hordeum vulgare]|nr:hypothetical protein D1007_45670 [Hordeum vulgare]
MPEPHDGECVVFGMHFIVGFGVPASRCMKQFLDFFGHKMNHLGMNSVLYLTRLATFCEGYLGFWMFPALFHLFFHFRAQKNEKLFAQQMTPDGPNPQTFASDREDSDAMDYELDGGDPAGPENPNALEVEEDDEEEEEEEAPTSTVAGGVGVSSGPCPEVPMWG